ncbi:MAG TPA: porin family protein [Vicinamibacterales bacterium]|nr:porin family protein [Vicinamibacterales bacterium]
MPSHCRFSFVVVLSVLGAVLCPPLGTLAHAQGVGGGVTFGLGRTEINAAGDESQNALFEAQNVQLKHKRALAGGGFLTLPLSKNLWIQPEVMLDLKGTQWKSGSQTARLRLTYVDVPVFLRYAGPEDDRVKVHVFAGVYTGVLVKATFDSGAASSTRTDVADRFRSMDFGWATGVGLGLGRVRLDLRYGGSLINIVNARGINDLLGQPVTSPPITYRNRGFALLTSYRF